MDYKRLFLNWIKQRDPQNKFEFYLQRHNQTLKSHVKNSSHFHHLIMLSSFSWLDTIEGFPYWANLYTDWLAFYNEWAKSHYNNNSHVNYDRS
jgi:hypothetical protein